MKYTIGSPQLRFEAKLVKFTANEFVQGVCLFAQFDFKMSALVAL
jgi:hypothetical protein